ncbi:MAG: FAD-dependent oxidoreductase, partial [Rhodospirillales bacterium]
MQQVSSIQKDIVLIGGGHSHLAVIKAFGMRPEPGVRITVVSKDIRTPYSGMMPGLIRGKYTTDQGYIDLNRLTRWAKTDLILEKAIKIDPVAQEVIFEHRPPISYDILSINVGSTPPKLPISGASDHALPIKPIDKFLDRLSQYEANRLKNPRITIAGAGAGGIETALALKDYFEITGTSSSISILSDDNVILPGHASSVRTRMKRVLAEKG